MHSVVEKNIKIYDLGTQHCTAKMFNPGLLQNQPQNFLKEVINQSILVQLHSVQRPYATRAEIIICYQSSDLPLTGPINQQPLLFSVYRTTVIIATSLMTLCGHFAGKAGGMEGQ